MTSCCAVISERTRSAAPESRWEVMIARRRPDRCAPRSEAWSSPARATTRRRSRISLRRLASRRVAPYVYFESKEALFQELHDALDCGLAARIEAEIAGLDGREPRSPRRVVAAIITAVGTQVAEEGDLCRVLLEARTRATYIAAVEDRQNPRGDSRRGPIIPPSASGMRFACWPEPWHRWRLPCWGRFPLDAAGHRRWSVASSPSSST